MKQINRNANGIELTITLPFKEDNVNRKPLKLSDYLKEYRDFLIKALEDRMEHCYNELVNHISEVTYNDGQQILWPYGKFNVPSYEKMNDALKALRQYDYAFFTHNPGAIDQMIKAIYMQEEKKPELLGKLLKALMIKG